MNKNHDDKTVIKKISYANIFTNIILGSSKIVFGTIFFSPALISDGIHSFSDLATDIAVVFSYIFSNRPKDLSHPYGHGKIENIGNLLIAVILTWAAVIIGISAYESLFDLKKINHSIPGLIVAGVSVISKEILYHVNIKAGEILKNDTLKTNAWHHRTDALSSIAVLIGMSLGYIDKNLVIADPIVCLGISALIIFIGIKILVETIDKIIDKNIDSETMIKIEHQILKNPDVKSLHNLRGRYYGGKIIIDFHIQLDAQISLSQAHEITHSVKNKIMENFPEIIDIIIHTEPDNKKNSIIDKSAFFE